MNLFIVGAGFTKAIFPNAPLNTELIEALAPKYPASASLKNKYETTDIEIALTKLDMDIVLSQGKDLRKLGQDIENELADYFTHVTQNHRFMI